MIKAKYSRRSFREKISDHKINFFGKKGIDFIKIMKFASKYYILLSTSLEMYGNREIPKKRIIMATIFRLCSLITGIRYSVSALVNTDWMSMVMSDGNQLITDQRLLSMCQLLLVLM